MNWIKYLKETSSIQKPIELLLSDAKGLAFPFLIGTDKYSIYGDKIAMMITSNLIANLPNLNADVIELATMFELTETNIPGFVYAWLMLNKFTLDRSLYSFKDLLIVREWLLYFGYSESLSGLIDDIVRLMPEVKSIDEDERTLLDKMFNQMIGSYLNIDNPLDYIDLDSYHRVLSELGVILNVPQEVKSNIELRGTSILAPRLFVEKLKPKDQLTDYEMELANNSFDSIVGDLSEDSDYSRRMYGVLVDLGKLIGKDVLVYDEYLKRSL